jgi:hypothetical protein
MPFNDPNDPRLIAARKILKAGLATTAEVGRLTGYTRQHIHRLTIDLQPVHRRDAHLLTLWKETLADEPRRISQARK